MGGCFAPLFLLDCPCLGHTLFNTKLGEPSFPTNEVFGDVSFSYLVLHSYTTMFVLSACIWPFLYPIYILTLPRELRKRFEYALKNDSMTMWIVFILWAAIAYTGIPIIVKELFHRGFEPIYTYFLKEYSLTTICTIGGTIIHIVVYSFLSIFAFILQNIPEFHESKIQKNKAPASLNDWWIICKSVLGSMFLWQLPFLFGQAAFVVGAALSTDYKDLASLEYHLVFLTVAMILEDVWHYMAHRTCHVNTWLYKNVHKLHHSYSNPFGPVAEHAHVVETLFSGIGFFLSAFMWDHLVTIYIWLIWRLALTHDDHFGYTVPIFPIRFFVPWHTGVEHHDFHHAFFNANYAPTFTWWDTWLGTDEPYNKHLSKQAIVSGTQIMLEKEEKMYGKFIQPTFNGTTQDNKDASSITEQLVKDTLAISCLDEKTKMSAKELEDLRLKQAAYCQKVAGENWSYDGLTVAITGSEGLVGKSLVRLLKARGAKKIVRIDILSAEAVEEQRAKEGPPSPKRGGLSALNPFSTGSCPTVYHRIDISDINRGLAEMTRTFAGEKVDVVLHLAALVGPFYNHADYDKVNNVGTVNVVKAVEAANVKVLVDCSSPCTRITGEHITGLTEDELTEQQGNTPCIHEYARTKYLGEKVVLAANKGSLKTCAVLPHQLYGAEDQLFLPAFIDNARVGKLRQLGRENVTVSFTHSENVAHGLLCAGKALLNDKDNKVGGQIYLVTDGNCMPIWDPIDKAVVKCNYTSVKRKLYVPRTFLLFLAYFLELVYAFINLFTSKRKFNKISPFTVRLMSMNRFMSIGAIKHQCNYVPLRHPVEAWEATFDNVVQKEKAIAGGSEKETKKTQ